MAMLYAAAEGETKQQIQKTFHYPSMDTLNPNSAALYNQFNKPNPDYKLATINDLWMQQGLTPNKVYVDTVQRYYGGQVTTLDFEDNPDPSRLIINKKSLSIPTSWSLNYCQKAVLKNYGRRVNQRRLF